MRLAFKRALDFHVGRPMLAVLNVTTRIVGAVLRRQHSRDPVRTILIAKFQGLGSLVSCKPALAQLRRSHPGARILFWGTPAMVQLARQMPEFDDVMVLDDRSFPAAITSTTVSLIRLWRARVDWAFDLEVYSRLSSVLITLTMARNRTGFVIEQLRSRRVHTHLMYFNRYLHLGEAYARLLGQLLPTGEAVDVNDYGTWRFANDPLPNLPRPYLLFNVHAGDLALERRWPRAHFRQLIGRLLELRPDAVAVLIGHGESEIAYTAQVAQGDRVIDLSGKLDLVETIRAIAGAELVVTNDSAPLHFALSTGTRVVGLFGPTRATSYVPPNRNHVAVAQVPIYCSPCVHHWEPAPCNGDNQCMKRLSADAVLRQCEELLALPGARLTTSVPPETDDGSSYYPGLVYRRTRPHGQA